MHNSQLVSNKVRYIELLGQDEAKRTSREIGNIFVPVLKRNGITQKRPPVKQGRQNFMNICKMYCASAHFSILLFSNQLFPQTGSTSVRQRSLTYFSFTANTSNLALPCLKPCKVSLENELRSKRELVAGLFFSEVQDEIRRFVHILFISTPFLEFWLFVMVAIGRRCRYYVTLQFSRKSSFVNRAQGFCYLLPRYSLLHAFTDRLILPFLSSAVDLHTWVVCIFDSGERYLIWSYVRLCVDEILECTLKKECEVIKHPWPVIFPSRDHKNF